MPTPDVLRLTLPSAVLLANGTQISAKEYPLILYARVPYLKVDIERISYSPAMGKTVVTLMRGGIEFGQFAGVDGQIPLRQSFDPSTELELRFYNLTIESELAYTLQMTGWAIGEIPA